MAVLLSWIGRGPRYAPLVAEKTSPKLWTSPVREIKANIAPQHGAAENRRTKLKFGRK